MCNWQYRLTVNGSHGAVLDASQDEQWRRVCDAIEARGTGLARYERRFVTDRQFLELAPDAPCMVIKDMVVCAWETLAEYELR